MEEMKAWNSCTIKEKIERWRNVNRVLKGLSPHQKKAHFNMSFWGKKTECGTVACAGGFCSLDPWFHKQGLVGEIAEDSDGTFVLRVNGLNYGNIYYLMNRFFGYEGSDGIFANMRERSVTQVMKEVSEHIKTLETQND